LEKQEEGDTPRVGRDLQVPGGLGRIEGLCEEALGSLADVCACNALSSLYRGSAGGAGPGRALQRSSSGGRLPLFSGHRSLVGPFGGCAVRSAFSWPSWPSLLIWKD
jgi:hypothetical protein